MKVDYELAQDSSGSALASKFGLCGFYFSFDRKGSLNVFGKSNGMLLTADL